MTRAPIIAIASLALTAPALAQIDLGIADDDVWAYVHAANPGGDPVLRVWGNDGIDLNPSGYPGVPFSQSFFSYAFLQWDLSDLPPDYRWNGATLTITVVEDSNYDPVTDDVYLRGLTGPFDETTWLFGEPGTEPIDAGRIVGDDSNYTGPGSQITFRIPRGIARQILRRWAADGRIYLAVTSGIDFDTDEKVLRFASGEHLLYDGPRLVLH